MSCAPAVHFTPCQNQYTTKSVKLESIHDKTSFSSSKSYFPPPTSWYCQEEWCWEFTIWSTWSNKKSQMTSENNTRSRQLVKLSFSWGTDKRIIIHNARLSICVLQTCICIINILVYFLLKMRERNILLCATVGILFSVSKEIKYHLYISC